jgi:hypothetical protein
MKAVMHLPTSVIIRGEVADATGGDLESVLLAAVRNAISGVEADDRPAVAGHAPRPAQGMPAESRHGQAAPAQVWEAAGSLADGDAEGDTAAGDAAAGGAPAGQAESEDQIIEGSSPFASQELMTWLRRSQVRLARGGRYVQAATFTHAFQLGQAIFRGKSFAILEGPLGGPASHFWAVATAPEITAETLGPASRPHQVAGGTVEGHEAAHRLVWTVIGAGRPYAVRAVHTSVPGAEWLTQDLESMKDLLAALSSSTEPSLPGADVGRLIFATIDQLVARIEAGDATDLQRAAELLSGLGEHEFSLVDWRSKAGYLKVLLASAMSREAEAAVVQIFMSLRNDSEVDAVIAMLRQAGRYDDLFDLDEELYNLLVVVGERFPRDHGPLTFSSFLDLLQSLGAETTMKGVLKAQLTAGFGPAAGLLGSVLDGDSVWGSLKGEARDALMGLVRFGSDLVGSVKTMITEPGKVIEGLARMLALVARAEVGDKAAIEQIENLLLGIGEKVLAGMRGAERLGCGEKVMRRIKWRLVWEIAAFFVGAGEVKAVIEGAGIAEKLSGVLRFLRVLTGLGEAVDVEVESARLARLAAMITAEGTFTSVGEAAELLARLPEADIRQLGRLISEIDIREGETLAELGARSADLHAAVTDAIAKTELLKVMAAKAGGLTDEIVGAFHALIGDDGFGLADAQKIVTAIPEGEGARFAATLKRMRLGQLAEDSRAAFLELVAGSTRRMDAVAKLGAETFTSVYRRAGGRGAMVDQYLGALDEIEERLAGQGGPGEFRRLLDRLERDDPASWLDVENTRRIRAGQRPLTDWIQQLGGSPKAQRALDRLLRRNQEGMVDSLIEVEAADRGLISDPEVLQALNEIADLSERELDGLLELKRYLDRDGAYSGYPEWNEILFTEPVRRRNLLELVADLRDPADPAVLVIKSGMQDVVTATLRHGGNIQGGLGHLEAARSLLRQFPGARMRFEVGYLTGGVQREVDIVMDVGGLEVDVEVKSYQATTAMSDRTRRQISKDLVRHLNDPGGPWEKLMWRFPDPGYAGNFATVERIFTEELELLHDQGRLAGPLGPWQERLEARFRAADPWKLIDILP